VGPFPPRAGQSCRSTRADDLLSGADFGVRSGLAAGGRWIRTFGSPFGNDDFRFRTIGGADAWLAGGGLEFAPDSPLGEDGFELSVPGDTIKVLRSLHVVPANAKSARTSSDTGEPAVGDRLPIVAHRMNGGGHRRPARSPPWSGDPAERYAMRVLVGQPFHPASPSARSSSRSCRCLLGLRA
jgi:hypothetical protein